MTTKTTLISGSQLNSRNWLVIVAIIFTIVGMGIAGYLTYTTFADEEIICVDSGQLDCNAVQSSAYSEAFGIPVAALGLGAYVTFFLLLVLDGRIDFITMYGRTIMFMLTLFGVIYSAYLTYIEAFVLEKWCQYCVASAILMVGLFVISAIRAWSIEDEEL
ncbi:MAG: vitamin K epoxide reductase family protein [Chloroflexi bacterium]|nr:vitamin K epoxide reductase family protein [Chloroflexota bacterium]